MLKFLPFLLLLMSGCSSSPDSTVPSNKAPLASISEAFTPQAARAEDVLFANLVFIDGQWQIQSIGSKRKPVDLLKSEERLYILTDEKIVMPDYVHFAYRDEAKRLFDCSQAVSFNRHTTYNPCTSQFTQNTKFGEGWFGWTKRLDKDSIAIAVKQSGLLERAEQEIALVRKERQRCLDLKNQAAKLASEQKLQLRVLDDTGMFKQGHELVKYALNITPDIAKEGCVQQLGEVRLNYELGIKRGFDLVLELRGKSDWQQAEEKKLILERDIAEADKQLAPTLYITGRKVRRYNLYQAWANQDLEVYWKTIDINDTDLLQAFDIRNLGKQKITIESISFIINQHVITQRNQHVLAPQSKETDLNHASRYFLLDKKQRKKIEAIKTIESGNEQAEFGIRIVYRIGKEQKILRKSEQLQLTSIL